VRETPLLKRIMLACSRGRSRLWRNNVGALRDAEGKWLRFGIANPGGSDLIGLHSLTITPEHIGRTFAIFVALEVKGKGGKVTKEQQLFIDLVQSFGGIAGVVRTVEQAEDMLLT